MPRVNEAPAESKLVKLLLMGYSKAGKTHYAAEAAKGGFNLLWLDGDIAMTTLAAMDKKIQERICLLDCRDGMDISRFCTLFKNMCEARGGFLWNDTDGRMVWDSDDITTIAVWEIFFTKLTPYDILVIDSWQALTRSTMRYFALNSGYDLCDMDREDNRNLYGNSGLRATWFLNMIRALNCHVIVTAIPEMYEKLRRPPGIIGAIKEKHMILEWTKEIPKSTSKNHGLTVAQFFTDILWIEPSLDGGRYIDGRPDISKEVGGRFTERKKSHEYSFPRLVELVGGIVPGPDASLLFPAVIENKLGEYERKVPEPLKGGNGGVVQVKKPPTLQGLIKAQQNK